MHSNQHYRNPPDWIIPLLLYRLILILLQAAKIYKQLEMIALKITLPIEKRH